MTDGQNTGLMGTTEQAGVIESPRTADELEVTAAQVIQMQTHTHVWRCPDCDHQLRFTVDEIDAIPFFIVRHLLRIHDIEPDRVITAEPSLSAEVREYCRTMGTQR